MSTEMDNIAKQFTGGPVATLSPRRTVTIVASGNRCGLYHANILIAGQADFKDFYYQTFDSNRAALSNLYRDGSMLTWESTQILGVSAIMEKLSGLPFSTVQHQITTLDAQPASSTTASLLVLVTGKLVIDGDNVLQYSQMFHLVPEGGSYFVQNDVFRLVYG